MAVLGLSLVFCWCIMMIQQRQVWVLSCYLGFHHQLFINAETPGKCTVVHYLKQLYLGYLDKVSLQLLYHSTGPHIW